MQLIEEKISLAENFIGNNSFLLNWKKNTHTRMSPILSWIFQIIIEIFFHYTLSHCKTLISSYILARLQSINQTINIKLSQKMKMLHTTLQKQNTHWMNNFVDIRNVKRNMICSNDLGNCRVPGRFFF